MVFKKRYILAQEAEERIVSLFRNERNDATEIFNTAIDACQTIILDMYDNAPDVVEVVRCKVCKKSGMCDIEDRGRRYDDNFYCAEGEHVCDGDCDYCKYKAVVPGTDERIDREPRYYCSLIFEAKENCKDEEKPL